MAAIAITERQPGIDELTVSLPSDLLAYIDWRATNAQASRDEVVALLLGEALRREQDRLMAEGYLSFYGLDEGTEERIEPYGWEEVERTPLAVRARA